MNRHIRMVLALVIYLTGFAVSIYVGGWVLIIEPVKGALAAHALGTLTFWQVVVVILKCVSSLTVAGLIWCLGYIVSNHIYDSRNE